MPGFGASSGFFSCFGFWSFFSAFLASFLAFLAAMGSMGASDGVEGVVVERVEVLFSEVAARDLVTASTLLADLATTGRQLIGRSLRGSLYSFH